jgi:hypothetical protein
MEKSGFFSLKKVQELLAEGIDVSRDPKMEKLSLLQDEESVEHVIQNNIHCQIIIVNEPLLENLLLPQQFIGMNG